MINTNLFIMTRANEGSERETSITRPTIFLAKVRKHSGQSNRIWLNTWHSSAVICVELYKFKFRRDIDSPNDSQKPVRQTSKRGLEIFFKYIGHLLNVFIYTRLSARVVWSFTQPPFYLSSFIRHIKGNVCNFEHVTLESCLQIPLPITLVECIYSIRITR